MIPDDLALATKFHDDAPEEYMQERDERKSREIWIAWAAKVIAKHDEEVRANAFEEAARHLEALAIVR